VPEIYSHSRLSSFESCPRKFHYRYVMKLPAEKESIEAFAGKRVHEVLERLYKAVAESRVPSIKRVLERFRALWDEHFDEGKLRIARAENGPRVPLAVLRKTARELPLQFALDDSQAMSPGMNLSSAASVRIEARISRTGNAVPQPGDLVGTSGVIKPGARDVRIVVDKVVP